MSNLSPLQAAPQRLPLLPHPALQKNTQHARTVETPENTEEVGFACKQNRSLLGGLPDDVWRIIFKNCCQHGASNLCSVLSVSKACYELADEARDWQIREFLFSAEAKAHLEKDSLNGLQNVFQMIRGVLEDAKIEQFLFSEETNALFEKKHLQALQSTFKAMRAAAEKGETLQAKLHKEGLQKITRAEFPKIVRAAKFKQEDPPRARLIRGFLLKQFKRGKFFEAMKRFPSRPLPTYENRYPDIYSLNLTVASLVEMDLCTLEEFGADASLDDEINDELGLFMLTHISSFFAQEKKQDMRSFIGLMPSWVWDGVVKTYKNCSLVGVEHLLASRVDVIAGGKTVHWPISKGENELLIVLLENNFPPDALNESGESALRCAIEADRSDMVDALLEHGAHVSPLLKVDGGIKSIRWAIARNKENFLKTLLALVVEQNVLKEALAYAKKMRRVNSSALAIVLERLESLGLVANYQGRQSDFLLS